MGERSPGSREAEGEGGEGFYVAQSGRCPDLLVIWGGYHAKVWCLAGIVIIWASRKGVSASRVSGDDGATDYRRWHSLGSLVFKLERSLVPRRILVDRYIDFLDRPLT